MTNTGKTYLPAAGHDWALPFYDPLLKLSGFDRTRDVLIGQAAIERGSRVLEIGCGTGTLVIAVKRLYPDAAVFGLDPDPKAIARARRKSDAARLPIQFVEGFAERLPYPDASFDRVLSSFMFHHLRSDVKTNALLEVRRVLRPGGSFHLVDLAPSRPQAGGFLVRVFHPDSVLAENAEDTMVSRMGEAGFTSSSQVKREGLVFGMVRVNYYCAKA